MCSHTLMYLCDGGIRNNAQHGYHFNAIAYRVKNSSVLLSLNNHIYCKANAHFTVAILVSQFKIKQEKKGQYALQFSSHFQFFFPVSKGIVSFFSISIDL